MNSNIGRYFLAIAMLSLLFSIAHMDIDIDGSRTSLKAHHYNKSTTLIPLYTQKQQPGNAVGVKGSTLGQRLCSRPGNYSGWTRLGFGKRGNPGLLTPGFNQGTSFITTRKALVAYISATVPVKFRFKLCFNFKSVVSFCISIKSFCNMFFTPSYTYFTPFLVLGRSYF